MIEKLIILIFGFFVLIKGADFLIDASSSIAFKLKVPKKIIGLIIIAIGTALPELSLAINAYYLGSPNMAFANVIGSNVMNIFLIIGLCALIFPISIRKDSIKKDLPFLLLVSALVVALYVDIGVSIVPTTQIYILDVLGFLVLFGLYIRYIIVSAKNDKNKITEYKPKYNMPISIALMSLGIVGLVLGSKLVITTAQDIASLCNISDRLIALTVLSLGTTLPELITCVKLANRREHDMLIGSIIGTNIVNICLVIGIPVMLFGTLGSGSFTLVDLFMLVFSSLVLYVFSKTDNKITKFEGLLLLITFMAFYVYTILIG